MCVKLLLKDLKSDSYLPHFTNTYTYKVTITSRMYDSRNKLLIASLSRIEVNFRERERESRIPTISING